MVTHLQGRGELRRELARCLRTGRNAAAPHRLKHRLDPTSTDLSSTPPRS